MGTFKIKKGLNLPINGAPKQEIEPGNKITRVGLLGEDYVGLKPTMIVQVGDSVKLGQVLFVDKKMTDVKYTSPGAGKIIEINRGEKRVFLSIVIQLEGNDEETFKAWAPEKLATLERETVKTQLIDSGLWTSLRARPFGGVANPQTVPHSIFVTAMDTNPLAPSLEKIVSEHEQDFINGLTIISTLTNGKVFLCKAPYEKIPSGVNPKISVEEFSGPHPAGNPGTHIHFVDPVGKKKTVWHIQAQDVIAIGKLFVTGKLFVERIIALAGPRVKNPRLIRTRLGACVSEITDKQVEGSNNRYISGSVVFGHRAADMTDYLGKYHQQVTVIAEDNERVFLGWLNSGFKLYSVKNILFSKLIPGKRFSFTTSMNGSRRAIVPIGSYEKVVPLDIVPSYLLRSIAVTDVEEAEKLGCLELVEEDLALCTFVCPSKIDHGINLRKTLTLIEKEG